MPSWNYIFNVNLFELLALLVVLSNNMSVIFSKEPIKKELCCFYVILASVKSLALFFSLIFVSITLLASPLVGFDQQVDPTPFLPVQPLGLDVETQGNFGFNFNTIPLGDLDFGSLGGVFNVGHSVPMGGVSSGGFQLSNSVLIQLSVENKEVYKPEFNFIVDLISAYEQNGNIGKLFFHIWPESVLFCISFNDTTTNRILSDGLRNLETLTIKAKMVQSCSKETLKPF